MRGYFAVNTISEEERSNILSQHKTLYNGYQTMNPDIPNTQPLYVQDFAKDKVGAVMGNNGNIKGYTNMGINENEKKMCEQCGGQMTEGLCEQCGSSMEGEVEEGTGKLDDIYDEEDLDPNAEFDYVKGASNKTNAFHVKEQMMKTPIGKISAIGGMEEQGGNADDMDVDDVEPAYNFDSEGPMNGGDVYPVNELDEDSFDDLINMDSELEYERDNLEQEGYEQMESAFADEMDEVDYNMGKNKKGQLPNPEKYINIDIDDDFVDYNMGKNKKGQLPNPEKYFDVELDEVDISGTQGVYGDVDPAYDFDSEGPGEGGPYQEYHGETTSDDDFDPTDKSWEEITQHTGGDEFGYVDEDIRESLIIQKNRIMEMMNRMKVIK
jgi:hypothetical protein